MEEVTDSFTEARVVQQWQRLFKKLAKECGIDHRLFRGVNFRERMERMRAFYDEGLLKPIVKDAVKSLPGVVVVDKVDLVGSRRDVSESKLVCAGSRFIGGERLAEEFPDYFNLFVSASQFNLLESPNEYHANLYDYSLDRTQGPTVCSLSLLGCLKRESQYDDDQLGDMLDEDVKREFKSVYQAGYLKAGFLEESQAQKLVLTLLKNPVKYAYQEIVSDVQKNPAYEKCCRQIFMSALSYQHSIDGFVRSAVTYVTLRGQYINALKDAINTARKFPNKQVALHIPCVGGGAFRNPKGTAQLAFMNAYGLLEPEMDGNLTVFLHGGDFFWNYDFEDIIRTCACDVINDFDAISEHICLSDQDKQLLGAAREELEQVDSSVVDKFIAKRGGTYYVRSDSAHLCLLHKAAKAGDVAEIERLLAAGVMIDGIDDNLNTALFVAAENGQKVAAERLLAAGAETEAIYATNKSPLSIAMERDHMDIAEMLK